MRSSSGKNNSISTVLELTQRGSGDRCRGWYRWPLSKPELEFVPVDGLGAEVAVASAGVSDGEDGEVEDEDVDVNVEIVQIEVLVMVDEDDVEGDAAGSDAK